MARGSLSGTSSPLPLVARTPSTEPPSGWTALPSLDAAVGWCRWLGRGDAAIARVYAQVGYDQLLVNHAPPFTSGEQVHLVDLSGTCWSHVGHICALAPLTHWACENGVEPLPDIPDDAWQISRDPDGAWLLISSDGRGPSRSPAPYLRLLSPATDVTWMQDLSNFRSLVEVRAGACTCSLPRPCFHSRVLAWLEAQHPAAFTDLRTQGR